MELNLNRDYFLNQTVLNDTNQQVDPFLLSFANAACKVNLIMTLLGIAGNLISICVFSQKKMIIRKFNWYLLILAIFELLFCIIISIDYFYRIFNAQLMFLHDLNAFTNIFIEFLIHTTDSFVIIITLILSIDRLYAIKNPIKIKDFITNLHSKFLMAAAFLALIIVKIPSSISCQQHFEQKFYIIYCTFISPLVLNIIPTIVILILNSLLVKEIISYYKAKTKEGLLKTGQLRKISDKRHSQVSLVVHATTKTKQKQISRSQKSHYFIIMALTVWTVLTSIPYYSLNTYLLLFRLEIFENFLDSKVIAITQVFSSMFFNSNHCINFFIYLNFYSEFRISIFRSCLKLSRKSVSLKTLNTLDS